MPRMTRAQLLAKFRDAPDETNTSATPPPGEVGLSGTNNWRGAIQAESNAKLKWTQAYGTPGSTAWGEWEKLHRTDHCVASALAQLAAPIRDSTVRVEVPESVRKAADEDDAEAKAECERLQAIADFCTDNVNSWLEPRLPSLLEQMVTYGLGYGFSLHECVWSTRPDDRVPGGEAVYLKKLAQRLPSSVCEDGWKEVDGELVSITQSGVRDGKWVGSISLPSDKCLLATWARNGNNYVGFSAFRSGWYMAQQRADILRILGIKHQRESCGVPVAEVEKDVVLSDLERDKLQTILESLVYHENAAIQLPAGVKINWVFSPGAANNAPLETWKALGTAIYELVQTQQTTLGTGETGSRAVGEVHAASHGAFVAGVRSWVEAAFNGIGSQPYTGVIRKLVDYNFGPQKVYPEFRLVVDEASEDATAQAAWAGAVTTLANGGAINLTPEDEAFAREKLGLPAPSEEVAVKQREMFAYHIQSGAVSINEVRAWLGLEPVVGGDQLIAPQAPAPTNFDATGKAQVTLAELLGEK